MSNHQRLTYLLHQVMAREASEEEYAEMLQLMQDPANEAIAKTEIFNAYKTAASLQDLEPEKSQQILNAIFRSDKEYPLSVVKQNRFGWRSWVAAAAVVLICASAAFYWVKQTTPVQNHPVAMKQDVLPGGNRATLTLADGKVISLTDANKGQIASEAGLVITKQADGQLLYEVAGNQENSDGYNTIATPYGGKYEVVLQDGTRVILNSGSKITYPLAFRGDQRKVTLSGEAYFEVAYDKNKTFIVNTPAVNGIQGQDIKVIGTHFNVNAYADDDAFITTLLEGSVKVATENSRDEKLLKPGSQAIVKQSILVRQANVDAAVAWTNNLFYFTDLPLKDMMRKLARWYDVEVVYEGEVPSIGFWAQISKNKKLSEVLSSIEATSNIHFRIEGKKLIVSR